MQTWPVLDRRLSFVEPPAFLVAVQRKERAWWRILLTLVLGGIDFVVASLIGFVIAALLGIALLAAMGEPASFSRAMDIIGSIGQPDPGGTLTDETVRIMGLGVLFGILAASLVATVAAINRRPMRSWITAAARFRWRLMFAGLFLYGAVLAVVLGLSVLSGDPNVKPPVFDAGEALDVRLIYLAIVLLAIPVAAAFEEILCRGWMMQLTGVFTHNILALLLINGAVFSLLHLDPDPGRFVARMATGVALSWATLRLGGLEFAIGAHAANNLMIALFAQTITASLSDMAPASLVETVIELVTCAALIGLAELVARHEPLRRWTCADLTATAGAAPRPSA